MTTLTSNELQRLKALGIMKRFNLFIKSLLFESFSGLLCDYFHDFSRQKLPIMRGIHYEVNVEIQYTSGLSFIIIQRHFIVN